MDRLTYQEEENALLHTLLDKRFFSVWGDPENPLWQVSSMELYITSECNLACEYCYLHKRGDDLYPQGSNNKAAVTGNLQKLLAWMGEKKFRLYELQLFSGEIWHLPYGFEVLGTILSHIQGGASHQLHKYPDKFHFC